MTASNTKDWELHAYIDWKPKVTDEYAPCEYCNGTGQIGGGFKDIDGPRECPRCFGSRTRLVSLAREAKPPVPQALIEHMRSAWLAYKEPEAPPPQPKD